MVLCAVLDDEQTGSLFGLSICGLDACPADIDAILISTDQFEYACYVRALETKLPLVRVYELLECPRSLKQKEEYHATMQRLRDSFTGKLNLGCGENALDGWTNIDGGDAVRYAAPEHDQVLRLDVFDALDALEDDSCDVIASEHFYEHFTLDDGYLMACAWHRVLRPGGVVRVVTPDLEMEAKILLGIHKPEPAELYAKHKARWLDHRHRSEAQRFLTPGMLLNFGMRLDGHLFVYDFDTLKAQLESAGFEDVRRCRFGESEHPDLAGIDKHDGGVTGGEWAKDIQLVVEAKKPK